MSYAYEAPGTWGAPWEWESQRRSRRGRKRRTEQVAEMSSHDDPPATGFADIDPEADEGPRRGGGHRHRGPGRGPGFGPGSGPGRPGPWGGRGPWGPPPGRRRERGDVRAAILLLLDEQPRHGYEILTEIADRSDGQWRPSPGSVYPVLKRLTREGLVEPARDEGRRVFSLTDEGRALVAAEREAWGEPWTAASSPTADAITELWQEGRQLGAAVWQVSQVEEPAQIEQARQVLADARKAIYRILAQD